jgi:hypothetical protein
MISCLISYFFDNIIVIYPFLALLFYDFAYDIIDINLLVDINLL